MKILKKIYHIGMLLQFCFWVIKWNAEPSSVILILYLIISGLSMVFSFKTYAIYHRLNPEGSRYKLEYVAIFSPWVWKKNGLILFTLGMIFLCLLVVTLTDQSLISLESEFGWFLFAFLFLSVVSWMTYKKSKFADLESDCLTQGNVKNY